MKEFYENELKMKNEIYEQNILHLNKTHQEEIRNLRIDYETKIDEIIKKNEEEKSELKKRINSGINLNLKSGAQKESKFENNTNTEMIDFQKKYLQEMKELQKAFEDFKKKTYEEFKVLKKAKEEAITRANYYKENYENLKNNEKISFKKEKDTQTNNLKSQLENSKSEINFLKQKINKLENFEKTVQTYLNNMSMASGNGNLNCINNNNNSQCRCRSNNNLNTPLYHLQTHTPNDKLSMQNIQVDMNYLTEGGESAYTRNVLFSNKSSDIVNYENCMTGQGCNNYKSENHPANIFSPPGTTKGGILIQDYEELSENLYQKFNKDSLEENLYKVIDLKKAHQKIKEMEDCLKSMNDENENLKGKLGYVISNINTPSHTGSNTPNTHGAGSVKRKGKTFSMQIFEDSNKPYLDSKTSLDLRDLRDLTPPVSKSRENKNQKVSQKEPQKEFKKETHNTLKTHKSVKSMIPNNISNTISNSLISYRKSNHNSNDEEIEVQETLDDNIFEFPLQLKIKGKIKKITTNSCRKSQK